jgi:hypothetical protein
MSIAVEIGLTLCLREYQAAFCEYLGQTAIQSAALTGWQFGSAAGLVRVARARIVWVYIISLYSLECRWKYRRGKIRWENEAEVWVMKTTI